MKNILKIPSLFIAATAMMLTSCSTSSIAGLYGFQMGKESGTHFGFFLKLTDKTKVIESSDPSEDTKNYKECEISFSVKFGSDTESISNIIALIAQMLGQEGNKITIPGYYYKSGKTLRDGSIELKLGIDFNFVKDVIEDIEIQDFEFPVLDPDMIEKVIYTTYLKNTVTVAIPVGFEDLVFQLYWYGIDFAYNEQEDRLYIVDLPEEQVHEPGTHPTPEDVERINQTYIEDHKVIIEKYELDIDAYRDYYTLAMGLVKK